MKICVAQTRSEKGNIAANIQRHQKLIELAIANNADSIFFPELSLTGYEPRLPRELATTKDDERLFVLQKSSDENGIIIGVGLPTKFNENVRISMVVFQPNEQVSLYSKQYLHCDEDPFFVKGDEQLILNNHSQRIGLAICFELTVREHTDKLFSFGVDIYLASVAKTATGMEKANTILQETARQHAVYVLVSNSTGLCDGEVCGGQSSIWGRSGELLAQMDENSEGLLQLDTITGETIRLDLKN